MPQLGGAGLFDMAVKKPRFFRFFKKPKNPISPNLGFFRFLKIKKNLMSDLSF